MLITSLASLGFILPLVTIFSPWLDFANYHLPMWAGWIGAAVFVFALWLLWRSHVDLGLNWTAWVEIREDHSLVTHGVFRHIRHPMYVAHLLWGVAQVLLIHNWIGGLSMLAFVVPHMLQRVPREERIMLEHFGDEYCLYMSRTGRILPRIR